MLFEKPGRFPGQVAGKSPYLQAVQITVPPGDRPQDWVGRLAAIRVTGQGSNSLRGELVAVERGGFAA